MPRFEKKTLEAVFAYHVVERIVAADAHLDPTEVTFLQLTYPLEEMVRAGFARETGELTPLFLEARDEALELLPDLLSLKEKLDLVSMFLDACVVDGKLEATEGSLLFEAATALGIGADQFDAHLDSLGDTVGTVELPDPEQG